MNSTRIFHRHDNEDTYSECVIDVDKEQYDECGSHEHWNTYPQ